MLCRYSLNSRQQEVLCTILGPVERLSEANDHHFQSFAISYRLLFILYIVVQSVESIVPILCANNQC